jgi:IS1 family transposase/transposase-like protein
MCEIRTKINCPHCQSVKVVKNGHKKDGTQNFMCKFCSKQFIASYSYKGANPTLKAAIIRHLERNNGIRDTAVLLQISPRTVMRALCKAAKNCQIIAQKTSYDSVQIDELWSYVGKKKKKRWLIYAYIPETKEILAYVLGSRGLKTVQKLYQMLKKFAIKEYCTDKWKAFVRVFSQENHRIGKEFTRAIEGVNTSLRARNRRFYAERLVFLRRKRIMMQLLPS